MHGTRDRRAYCGERPTTAINIKARTVPHLLRAEHCGGATNAWCCRSALRGAHGIHDARLRAAVRCPRGPLYIPAGAEQRAAPGLRQRAVHASAEQHSVLQLKHTPSLGPSKKGSGVGDKWAVPFFKQLIKNLILLSIIAGRTGWNPKTRSCPDDVYNSRKTRSREQSPKREHTRRHSRGAGQTECTGHLLDNSCKKCTNAVRCPHKLQLGFLYDNPVSDLTDCGVGVKPNEVCTWALANCRDAC